MDSLTNDFVEQLFIQRWIAFCNGFEDASFIRIWWYCWVRKVPSASDEYEGCYDDNYNLTTIGLEKQNAAMVAQYEQSCAH